MKQRRIYRDGPGAALLIDMLTRDGWRVRHDGVLLVILEMEV